MRVDDSWSHADAGDEGRPRKASARRRSSCCPMASILVCRRRRAWRHALSMLRRSTRLQTRSRHDPLLKTDFWRRVRADARIGFERRVSCSRCARSTLHRATRSTAAALKMTGEPRPIGENVFVSTCNRTLASRSISVSEAGDAGLSHRHAGRSSVAPAGLASAATARRRRRSRSWADSTRSSCRRMATKVVTSRTELETGNNADLWITDLAAETSTKFTFGGGANVQPVWSPDGRYIAWVGRRGEDAVLYRKPADGSGGEEVLYRYAKNTVNVQMSDWSPHHGQMLVYARGGDVFALPVGPGSDAVAPADSDRGRLRPRSSARLFRRMADGSPTSPTRPDARRSTCSRSSSTRAARGRGRVVGPNGWSRAAASAWSGGARTAASWCSRVRMAR